MEIKAIALVITGCFVSSCFASADAKSPNEESTQKGSAKMTFSIKKSDDEWRKMLSPVEFNVLREAGTERAFSGAYWNTHDDGVYHCRGCNAPLFSSTDKFDSGTGWPSYTQALAKNAVTEIRDETHGMVRVEVVCSQCGGHLGHVFDDGPRPTGLRYCMNSASLVFVGNKKPQPAGSANQ